jgi:MFS superfamily sulfate permease-like transporter
MAKSSSCSRKSCGATVEGTVGKCPNCGAYMQQSSSIRTVGCVIFFIGLFFAGAFGAIMLAALPTMLDPAAAIANHTANGTLEQMKAIRLLFLSFLFAGLVFLIFGTKLLKTGRPVRNLSLYALLALAPMFWAGYGAYQLMEKEIAGAASGKQ